MAIVKRSIIGELKGSLSDIVFRVRNGKVVAYTKPVKQKVSNSKASVNARKRFAITVALARKVNSDPLLSAIWKSYNIKATNAYQKIIKVNSGLSEPDCLSINNKITPDSSIIPHIKTEMNSSVLNIKIYCDKVDKKLLKSARLYYLLFYYDIPPTRRDKIIELQHRDLPDLSQYNEYNLSISIDGKNNYKNVIVLMAITNQPEENKNLIWSRTIGIELN